MSDRITNEIIQLIEKAKENNEVLKFKDLFKRGLAKNIMGRRYSGLNLLRLTFLRNHRDYTSQLWATYNQIKNKGGYVKKGEQGSPVFYFAINNYVDKKDEKEKSSRLFKPYTVFNIDQCHFDKGFHEKEIIKPLDNIEQWLKLIPFKLTRERGRAYYDIEKDCINVPPLDDFQSINNYYAVLFHELVHWTMKKGRAYRKEAECYHTDIKARAFEELVAEIGACFLMSELNIDGDTKNSRAYLDSWLNESKQDVNYINQSAIEASRAIEFLIGGGEEVINE